MLPRTPSASLTRGDARSSGTSQPTSRAGGRRSYAASVRPCGRWGKSDLCQYPTQRTSPSQVMYCRSLGGLQRKQGPGDEKCRRNPGVSWHVLWTSVSCNKEGAVNWSLSILPPSATLMMTSLEFKMHLLRRRTCLSAQWKIMTKCARLQEMFCDNERRSMAMFPGQVSLLGDCREAGWPTCRSLGQILGRQGKPIPQKG